MTIAESIECSFGIIQSPDLENLRIKIEASLPNCHLDDYMLSLKLHPSTSKDEAKQLETMLNEHVATLLVSKTSELESAATPPGNPSTHR